MRRVSRYPKLKTILPAHRIGTMANNKIKLGRKQRKWSEENLAERAGISSRQSRVHCNAIGSAGHADLGQQQSQPAMLPTP
jgi:hypothetical protein